MTCDLRKNIRKRNRFFRQAQLKRTQHSWQKWKEQRNLVTDLNKRLKSDHLSLQVNKLLEYKNNPHKYHQILKTTIGSRNDRIIPPLELPNGETVTENEQKATLLNNFFAKHSRQDVTSKQTPIISKTLDNIPTLETVTVTERETLLILNRLDEHKSCGPDMLPNKIFKLTGILIAEPLTQLFNKSLSCGRFPHSWKEAIVHPVFKNKGSSSDPQNYRPISLLPCISKILEKIVYNRIYSHLTENQLLTEKQSGYRPKHSTYTASTDVSDASHKQSFE